MKEERSGLGPHQDHFFLLSLDTESHSSSSVSLTWLACK